MVPPQRPHRTENRVGLYAWAGPDTIRMTRLKYGDGSRIDERSFLELYDAPALHHLRATLGVTDMWVTFSWGFGDAVEREQRTFLRDALPRFRDAGIATHAYVQGFNVVTNDFAECDFFCKDALGRMQPYARGRSLICPNAPATQTLLKERVAAACAEDVDGIFIDNMLFGMPPVAAYSDFLPPFGCACAWCDAAFMRRHGAPLARNGFRGERAVADILRFRTDSIASVIAECSHIARNGGKQFGVNLYDPLHHTPELYFGYGLAAMEPHLDYRLIENHALRPDGTMENAHLAPLIDGKKPTFVVSYRNGIGRDGAYGQSDIDAIFADAKRHGYAPCLKASEYVTRGVWHALRWKQIDTPKPLQDGLHPCAAPPPLHAKPSTAFGRALTTWLGLRMARLSAWSFACGPMRTIVARSPLYTALVRKFRLIDPGVWGLGEDADTTREG